VPQAMFGCRAEDVVGHALSELLPPACRANHPNLVRHFGLRPMGRAPGSRPWFEAAAR
jgi:hypothetical protein